MMSGQEKRKPQLGNVSKIEQQLYSKNTKLKEYERYGFHDEYQYAEIKDTWQEEEPEKKEVDLIEKQKPKSKPLTPFAKIFVGSVLFFVFSVMAAVLVFILNTNQVDYSAVRLSILGPNSVAGGEELQFDISITNDNPVNMVLTDVIVNYPRGTITADDEGLPMERDIRSIEEIRSGLAETVKFKAVLFGAEGEAKDINIVFQYRVPDSDIIFFKERSYQVQLESAPVVLSVDHDNRFQSGEMVEVTVNVVSNASKVLRNLFLSIDYPFGFEFATSSPSGIDSSSYLVGDLLPGETYTLILSGYIRGQDDEQRTIRYALGAEDRTRPGNMGTVFTVNDSALTVTKPPIALAMSMNEEASPIYVAYPGQQVDFSLEYHNNLQTKLLDNVIDVSLEGSGYDRRTVDGEQGYYRSVSDSISWTQTEVSALDEIEPGEKGRLIFNLKALPTSAMAGLMQNPELVITTRAEATNFELGGEEKRISHEIINRVKVATEPTVNAYLLHSEGPLVNSGPIQPVVGTLTTYTLVLRAGNTTNTIKNTEVSFTLPRYVSLREIFIPEDADIDYDERSRTVTWRVGEIEPGVGFTKPHKEVFLSLSFEPSLDQVNLSPDIVENIEINAVDVFAEVPVRNTMPDLNTVIRQDAQFISGNVQEASL